jgi:dihydroxyacetone kinase-like protein
MSEEALLGLADITGLLSRACRRIERETERLSELDAACGDGDHGVSMARGFRAVEKKLRTARFEDPASVLRITGQTLVSSVGGATGPLLGTLFLEAAKALASSEEAAAGRRGVGTRSLAAAFRAGLDGVCRRGGAKPGDKTMVDSLLPAVEALEAAAGSGAEPGAALVLAARAARSGAAATAGMTARQGRARYLGERARGFEDAGANSVAALFEAFADTEGTGPMQPEERGAKG